MTRIILILLSATLIACSATPNKHQAQSQYPEWITELPIQSGWVFGVGSADLSDDPAISAKLARQRARLDLARSLKTEIEGQFQMQTRDDNGEVSRRASELIKSGVASIELSNIEIKESVTRDKQIFVLVALERSKEVGYLRSQQRALEEQATNWIPSLEVSIQELRKLIHWQDQLARWYGIQDQIHLISGRVSTVEAPDFANKYYRFNQYLESTVVIQTDGVSQKLAQSTGWPVSQLGGNLVLTLDTHVESIIENDTFYYFITGHIVIHDVLQQDNIQIPVSIRAVSSIQTAAQKKAEFELEKLIKDSIAMILPDPSRI